MAARTPLHPSNACPPLALARGSSSPAPRRLRDLAGALGWAGARGRWFSLGVLSGKEQNMTAAMEGSSPSITTGRPTLLWLWLPVWLWLKYGMRDSGAKAPPREPGRGVSSTELRANGGTRGVQGATGAALLLPPPPMVRAGLAGAGVLAGKPEL